MYAWFRDRETARQFVTFVEALQSKRHLRPDMLDHLATTHALALGGVLVLHPRQRLDVGYAVPLTGRREVAVYRARPWWRRLLQQMALTLLVAAGIWVVGAFIWLVERGLPW